MHVDLVSVAFVSGQFQESVCVVFLYQNAGGEEMDIGKTGQTLKRMARSSFSLPEVTSPDRKCFQNNAGSSERRHAFLVVVIS